jgi:hypothetical protein
VDITGCGNERIMAGHERISPTAWIVAYCRTLSDIPYSKEIFQEAADELISPRQLNLAQEQINNALDHAVFLMTIDI